MNPKYVVGISFELVVTALFATVFTYFAMRILHTLQGKEMPKNHMFNKRELFLSSFFTAMIVFVLLKIFDWKDVFYEHHKALFMH